MINPAKQDTTLAQLKVGDTAQVLGFKIASKVYRQKLLSMGLTPGTEFTVTRIAPLNDPIELHLRGFALSLRKHEAVCLRVERIK